MVAEIIQQLYDGLYYIGFGAFLAVFVMLIMWILKALW